MGRGTYAYNSVDAAVMPMMAAILEDPVQFRDFIRNEEGCFCAGTSTVAQAGRVCVESISGDGAAAVRSLHGLHLHHLDSGTFLVSACHVVRVPPGSNNLYTKVTANQLVSIQSVSAGAIRGQGYGGKPCIAHVLLFVYLGREKWIDLNCISSPHPTVQAGQQSIATLLSSHKSISLNPAHNDDGVGAGPGADAGDSGANVGGVGASGDNRGGSNGGGVGDSGGVGGGGGGGVVEVNKHLE
ncbi:hypothetical protein SELMODRAFT_427441 [Selaginella moellendorffii]|uniref:Uncharacterized protein n=1 Tax=Selaginella moellendorffii TaxID=88036 RepID=D8SZM6_SELML|nr:hypothetical protein SELMODRAFT_427441 [Selaginella moellendorffii]